MTSSLQGPSFVPSDAPPQQAVVFLHGLGSNGNDLMGLAPLMRDSLPRTAFFAPNAPLTIPQMYDGYQWFPYWDSTPLQIMQGVLDATPLLEDYISDISEKYSIPLSKIVLVGFSQGTMMALHVGLRALEGLGGIVGFSGALMSPETLAQQKNDILPKVLLVHGLQDPVVPAMASQQAEVMLKMIGAQVTYVQRPMLDHSIDNEGIQHAVDFCRDVFTL